MQRQKNSFWRLKSVIERPFYGAAACPFKSRRENARFSGVKKIFSLKKYSFYATRRFIIHSVANRFIKAARKSFPRALFHALFRALSRALFRNSAKKTPRACR